MTNFEYGKCPVCGADNTLITRQPEFNKFIECETCGRFEIYSFFDDYKIDHYKDELASYLFYNNGKTNMPIDVDNKYFFNYIGPEEEYKKEKEKYDYCYWVNESVVKAWYPRTFSEKVDLFLLFLAKRQSRFAEVIVLSDEDVFSACFIKKQKSENMRCSDNEILKQIDYFLNYFIDNELLDCSHNKFVILPKGLQRIDELQKTNSNNKNVFVSMAFNDDTKETREAIRKGIVEGKFSPEFIDEIIHNKQIVPEMFRLIRESRFLILDISEPNYGAYYEAGYALGLGKEVIITCNEDVFNSNIYKYSEEEMKKFGKFLKPHFDIAQKQILVWKDYEDLTKKLSEWIKALF